MEIFNIIGVKEFTFIEIGVQDSIECNSTNLLLNLNWKGAQFEGCKESYEDGKKFFQEKNIKNNQCQLLNKFIDAENINLLIQKTGIIGEIDFFSLDIDGNDYWVWKNISIIKPRLVVLEYNSSFGKYDPLTIPYNPQFIWSNKDEQRFFYGASLKALEKLSEKKGYNLICVDRGYLILIDSIAPKFWGINLLDLKSRILSSITVNIKKPDDELLSSVLIKLFLDKQILIDKKIIKFIVYRSERSFANLQSLVDKIDKQSLLTKKKININFVKKLI